MTFSSKCFYKLGKLKVFYGAWTKNIYNVYKIVSMQDTRGNIDKVMMMNLVQCVT
jgi:hypothetical protein